jgi:HK97 family phage portal protein
MAAVAERRWLGLRRGRDESRALTRDSVPAVMLGEPTVAGVPVNERTALQQVDVLACVRCLAETAATLPLIAYRRRNDGGRDRLPGGRLVELLRRPAPAVTQAGLVGQLVSWLACRGNCFLGKYRNGDGQIEQIGVLPGDRVTVEVKGGMPFYTLVHGNGRVTTHGTEDILHVRLPVTDSTGILGLSPIGQAREAIGLNRALGEQASALAANDSAPRGVLSVPPGPGAEDLIENLRGAWAARHAGPKNAGRVAVVSGDISFSAVTLSARDAEFVAQRELSTAEIARLFRIPPWVLGARSGDSLTYSNVESQMRALLVLALNVYLVCVEQAVSNDADLCAGPNVYVEFERAAVLQADALQQAQILQLALDPQKGWMTRAEARQRMNLPAETEAA